MYFLTFSYNFLTQISRRIYTLTPHTESFLSYLHIFKCAVYARCACGELGTLSHTGNFTELPSEEYLSD